MHIPNEGITYSNLHDREKYLILDDLYNLPLNILQEIKNNYII
jgi:hypothetical protein